VAWALAEQVRDPGAKNGGLVAENERLASRFMERRARLEALELGLEKLRRERL